MDIFDRIIAATSMNEEQRKLKAIPLLQELVTLTTGEECFLKLNEKSIFPLWQIFILIIVWQLKL